MRIIVTGGRDFDNDILIYHILSSLNPTVIGVGDCPTGVDRKVMEWVKRMDSDGRKPFLTVYKADWKTHGKAAGPIRNKAMIDGEAPWFCLAFPGGKGTEDCIRQCKEAEIPVLRVE